MQTIKSSPSGVAGSTIGRLWEIDALRGVAIVSMVFYHFMWDLYFFGVVRDIALQRGGWKYFQRSIAITFIFLVGVSLVISYQYARQKGGAGFSKFLKRGLLVLGCGLALGLGVRFANVGRIDFGVLHLIGFSIIVAYPFLQLRWINIGLWVLFNLGASFLQQPRVDHFWLTWLGFYPPQYSYLDYFPVLPWFGVVLLGIGVGNLLYVDFRASWRERLPDLSGLFPVRGLRWLGQRSLPIYLLHQPILFGLLFGWLYLRS